MVLPKYQAKLISCRNFRHLIAAGLLQLWLFHQSNGVHLTNTISFTAIDLAKSAGMDEDDISAAIPVTEEEGLEALFSGGIGAMQDSRKNRQHVKIPSISEIAKSSSEPVLPLCCSLEAEDPADRCDNGASGSSEKSANSFKRKWTAPSQLVSTGESTIFK